MYPGPGLLEYHIHIVHNYLLFVIVSRHRW